jgi:hypothetical protein
LKAVQKVISDNQVYWPLTGRQIHYRLLNNPPLKDSSKDGRMMRRGTPSQDSTYANDKGWQSKADCQSYEGEQETILHCFTPGEAKFRKAFSSSVTRAS